MELGLAISSRNTSERCYWCDQTSRGQGGENILDQGQRTSSSRWEISGEGSRHQPRELSSEWAQLMKSSWCLTRCNWLIILELDDMLLCYLCEILLCCLLLLCQAVLSFGSSNFHFYLLLAYNFLFLGCATVRSWVQLCQQGPSLSLSSLIKHWLIDLLIDWLTMLSIWSAAVVLMWQGVKEVTLLGQNVNSYRDVSSEDISMNQSVSMSKGFRTIYKLKPGGRRFSDLLDRASLINPEMRIRFTSPHPKDFPDEVSSVMLKRFLDNIPRQYSPVQYSLDNLSSFDFS